MVEHKSLCFKLGVSVMLDFQERNSLLPLPRLLQMSLEEARLTRMEAFRCS